MQIRGNARDLSLSLSVFFVNVSRPKSSLDCLAGLSQAVTVKFSPNGCFNSPHNFT